MSTLRREFLSEFFGTFVLIVFGVGVVAQVNLGGGANGQYLSINIGWGLAVMIAAYVAGVSGAHLNPAVTLAAATFRGFAWPKVVPYIVAQTAGAFVAAAVVFLTYHDAIQHFDGGVRQVSGALGTAGIFSTYPQPWLTTVSGFVDQVLGTALLIIGIFAVTDEKNLAPPSNLGPVAVGLLVLLIGATYGLNAGYAINPARDFGPRLFTAVAGWGSGVFTAANNWWWVPIAGPLVGGLVGGLAYDLFIGWQHPAVREARG